MKTDNILLSWAYTPSFQAGDQLTYDGLGLVVADGPLCPGNIVIDLYSLSFPGKLTGEEHTGLSGSYGTSSKIHELISWIGIETVCSAKTMMPGS